MEQIKRIIILGSTGSVGISTLNVLKRLGNMFKVVGLSTYSNIELLKKQAEDFFCTNLCVVEEKAARRILHSKGVRRRLYCGQEGLLEMIRNTAAEELVLALSGSSALMPLLEAIRSHKDIILANKEALVMAGSLVMKEARKNRVMIKPVDSEQSAIWQCLHHNDKNSIKRVYLTASGGPFWGWDRKSMLRIKVEDALRHPRWKMGKKISIDSATLMNKGLEVIEAMHLFSLPWDKIKVVIHPQSIVHSMVEFQDGIILAQLATTDMQIPIQYALTYPLRLPGVSSLDLDLLQLGKLTFESPDEKKFPCLALAWEAAKKGGSAPCVLNVANEISVEEFLKGNLNFLKIPEIIAKVLRRHKFIAQPSLEDIINTKDWAEQEARRIIYNGIRMA